MLFRLQTDFDSQISFFYFFLLIYRHLLFIIHSPMFDSFVATILNCNRKQNPQAKYSWAKYTWANQKFNKKMRNERTKESNMYKFKDSIINVILFERWMSNSASNENYEIFSDTKTTSIHKSWLLRIQHIENTKSWSWFCFVGFWTEFSEMYTYIWCTHVLCFSIVDTNIVFIRNWTFCKRNEIR